MTEVDYECMVSVKYWSFIGRGWTRMSPQLLGGPQLNEHSGGLGEKIKVK